MRKQWRRLKGHKSVSNEPAKKSKKEKQEPSVLDGTIGLKSSARNKKCPCMSGKKAKNCCLGVISTVQPQVWHCQVCDTENKLPKNLGSMKRTTQSCINCQVEFAIYAQINGNKWEINVVMKEQREDNGKEENNKATKSVEECTRDFEPLKIVDSAD